MIFGFQRIVLCAWCLWWTYCEDLFIDVYRCEQNGQIGSTLCPTQQGTPLMEELDHSHPAPSTSSVKHQSAPTKKRFGWLRQRINKIFGKKPLVIPCAQHKVRQQDSEAQTWWKRWTIPIQHLQHLPSKHQSLSTMPTKKHFGWLLQKISKLFGKNTNNL